jgi:hypothetical protein
MIKDNSYLIQLSNGDLREVKCLLVSDKGYKLQNSLEGGDNDIVSNFAYWILKTDTEIGLGGETKYKIIEQL